MNLVTKITGTAVCFVCLTFEICSEKLTLTASYDRL